MWEKESKEAAPGSACTEGKLWGPLSADWVWKLPHQSQLGCWAAGVLGASELIGRRVRREGEEYPGDHGSGGAYKVNKEALLGRWDCRKTESL